MKSTEFYYIGRGVLFLYAIELSVVQKFSHIFAMVGIFALLGSGAAWWNVFRQRRLQPAGRLERDTRENRGGNGTSGSVRTQPGGSNLGDIRLVVLGE